MTVIEFPNQDSWLVLPKTPTPGPSHETWHSHAPQVRFAAAMLTLSKAEMAEFLSGIPEYDAMIKSLDHTAEFLVECAEIIVEARRRAETHKAA